MKVWVVTDGKIGTEKQCIALAQALGLSPQIKRIQIKPIWKYFPFLSRVWPLHQLSASGDRLSPPWPDLIIASSRIAASPVAYLKKKLGNTLKAIYIQNPKMPSSCFDLVIAPQHDAVTGVNVISTLGALSFFPQKIIQEHVQELLSKLPQNFPNKKISILIGGNSRHHTMTAPHMRPFVFALKNLLKTPETGLLISTSRRTPQDIYDLLKEHLSHPHVYIWDQKEPNPYLGFLGLADGFIVTSDSVSMITETLTRHKPVFVFELPCTSQRLKYFIDTLRKKNLIYFFKDIFDFSKKSQLNEMETIKEKVLSILKRS